MYIYKGRERNSISSDIFVSSCQTENWEYENFSVVHRFSKLFKNISSEHSIVQSYVRRQNITGRST